MSNPQSSRGDSFTFPQQLPAARVPTIGKSYLSQTHSEPSSSSFWDDKSNTRRRQAPSALLSSSNAGTAASIPSARGTTLASSSSSLSEASSNGTVSSTGSLISSQSGDSVEDDTDDEVGEDSEAQAPKNCCVVFKEEEDIDCSYCITCWTCRCCRPSRCCRKKESVPSGRTAIAINDHQERTSQSESRGCCSTVCRSIHNVIQKISDTKACICELVEFRENADPEGPGCCALLLALVSILLIIATLPFSLCMCIKVVQEYERSVIFRLGRLRKGGAKGPGIFFIIPCIDTYRKVDLRTVSFDVPPQEVLSRDSVTVTVDAVVYYRVSNPTMATNNVEDFSHSTHLLAATTLRNVLGTKHLAEILSERETISHVMEQTLDEATDPWGVKVERVEIKDVRLPVQLQRAMAAEAEAAREARAKVIAAEGEQKASRALREASDVISESPSALQLRYLQTLNTISAEKNSTIIFPVPLDIISHFFTGGKKQA
ncbi:band 7 protein AGAP004871-like isoform X4 [Tigriopus californicus]|uniref:band 7 protein AGAP004871-like isoform X4 n=1 Tax=Tigriopus californicus TaxID=6832 RepID=UPI0027D9CFB7|nr:band 7 protein AGAP004871-like isoform X4 [Tigriopus californicus]